MGPLSEELDAGQAEVASLAAALAVSEACRTASAGRLMAAPIARAVLAGRDIMSSTAWPASRAGDGSSGGRQPDCSSAPDVRRGATGLSSKITRYSSVPDTPSTIAWCTLEISAHRLSLRP